jgi:hypothetical protein
MDPDFSIYIVDSIGGAERDRTAGLLVAKTMMNAFSTT